jgi:hypothetical protein
MNGSPARVRAVLAATARQVFEIPLGHLRELARAAPAPEVFAAM